MICVSEYISVLIQSTCLHVFLLRAVSVPLSLEVCAKAENFRTVFILNLNLNVKGKGVINKDLCFLLTFAVSVVECCPGITKELLSVLHSQSREQAFITY